MEQCMVLLSFIASCFAPSHTQTLNGKRYRLLRLLGEGGFSYVYLVQEVATGQYWALKKVGCSIPEIVNEAMKEVDAYKRFHHPNIIQCHDFTLVQESQGKTLYLVLPYYKRGNLQDAINVHLEQKSHFRQDDLLRLFRGVCLAVRAMHIYTTEDSASAKSKELELTRSETGSGSVIDSHVQEPLMSAEESGVYDEVGPGSGADARTESLHPLDIVARTNDGAGRVIIPYAHRDIKPSNVMLADDGRPILMDFGSAMRARVEIKTRQDALMQQDLAAEKSTMPYRAPELFDAKTGSIIDEKVDIWSLGCLLFAMAYGHSPFENPADPGGSIAMAVLNNQYRFPSKADPFSEELRQLIRSLLVLDPSKRPDIQTVLNVTEALLEAG